MICFLAKKIVFQVTKTSFFTHLLGLSLTLYPHEKTVVVNTHNPQKIFDEPNSTDYSFGEHHSV